MPYAKDHKTNSTNRILASAIELFSRYGFDKVSIAQIMRAAKMTHGAFYAHFESKEALFRASFLEMLKGSRAARLMKGPLSIKHLTALVTHYWNLREMEKNSGPGPEMLLFNEAGNQNASVKPLFEESYNNLKKMVETRLLALSKLKQLPYEANREIIADKARTMLSLLVGAVVVAKSISGEEERFGVLEAAQKQILNMLGINNAELAE
jgi:TetR/AcrR family transcriptional repressor of nem operon